MEEVDTKRFEEEGRKGGKKKGMEEIDKGKSRKEGR